MSNSIFDRAVVGPWSDPFGGQPVNPSGQGFEGLPNESDAEFDSGDSTEPKVSLLDPTASDPAATPAAREAARLHNQQVVAGLGIVATSLGRAGDITVAALNNASAQRLAEINQATQLELARIRQQAVSQGGTLTADQSGQLAALQTFQAQVAQMQADRESDKNTLMYVGLGVLGLAVIGGGFYFLSKRGGRARANPSGWDPMDEIRDNPVVGRGLRSAGEPKHWITPAQARRRKARRRAGK